MMAAAPLRVGLFGHGWWSKRYLAPALIGAGAVVAGVCGRDLARADAASREFGTSEPFDRLETMLDTVELDALVVASPPASHVDAVVTAAARGLPVFCEKPLARNADETKTMTEACAGLPTVAGFTQRWNAAIRTAHGLLGELGELRHLRYTTASSLSADASAPWDWRYGASEYSYGVLSDLGPHAVDLARWFGGEVTAVSATGTTVVGVRADEAGVGRAVENWDDCTLDLTLASGARCSLVTSRVLPSSPYRRFRHELELIGDRGTLAYTSDRPAEVVLALSGKQPEVVPADGMDLGDAAPGSFEEVMAAMNHGARTQAGDMLAAFRGQHRAHVPTLADGHLGQLVLDAAARSITERAPIPVA
ncbi:Gfo/Idh/MocA family protein [Amycolatopsis sp. cg5]|uniref:Gfo/Idh/MocA family protein n=1 Tax=Amycolatopsis sp. cg5 TaxID=3238802 RepID=UPI0035248061